MDSPLSETSTAFDFGPVPTSEYKEHQPPPLMSTEQPLVPPVTYYYRRDGWFGAVRIWNVPSDPSHSKKESSLIAEDLPTCNPFATLFGTLGGCSADDRLGGGDVGGLDGQSLFSTPPSHFIKRTGWRWYALSEGAADQSQAGEEQRVIDFQTESWWGTTSIYNQTDDPSRHGIMGQAKGLNPWWSFQRTLDDFDGERYSCRTAWCSGNITLTRLSDDVVMARFIRPRFGFNWGLLGMLQVVEPVSRDLLHLILSAIYIKYEVDRNRERSRDSDHRRPRRFGEYGLTP